MIKMKKAKAKNYNETLEILRVLEEDELCPECKGLLILVKDRGNGNYAEIEINDSLFRCKKCGTEVIQLSKTKKTWTCKGNVGEKNDKK